MQEAKSSSPVKESIDDVASYGKIARNSLMLLVTEPPQPGDDFRIASAVEEARESNSKEGVDFLNQVKDGVRSPAFSANTPEDCKILELLVADTVRMAQSGTLETSSAIFTKLNSFDNNELEREAQKARFAYLAAGQMRYVSVPFFQAPGIRIRFSAPSNLAEFIDLTEIVKRVTDQAKGENFHKVVQRNNWRVAFAFWESSRQLSSLILGQNLDSIPS